MWRRLFLLTLSSISLLAFAPTSAFAHHADVTIDVDCGGLVTYTATSWATSDIDHRINESVSISINGIAATSGGFSADNSYSLGGTLQLPTPLPATATATVTYGNFGPGGIYGSAGSATSNVATVPACPAQPAATIADVECSQGGALVTLSNSGGAAATLRITKGGALVEDVSVAGGASTTRLVPVAEDTTADIAVTNGGAAVATRSVHANCVLTPAVPAAAIAAVDCSQGGALVTLSNSGETATTFTIASNGAIVGTYPVSGNGSSSQLVAIAENATATIVVSSSGLVDVTRTLTRDCIAPAAPSAVIGAVVCEQGGAFIIVNNTGGEATTFTVTAGGTVIDTLVVTGGATATKLVTIAEDSRLLVAVTAPGMTTVSGTVSRDCIADATPTAPGTADAGSGPGPNDVVNVPEASTTGTGTGAGAPDSSAFTVIPGTLGAGGVAAATGGTAETAAATQELPFTGASGLRGLFYGALLALLLGSVMSLSGRRAARRAQRTNR